MLGGGGGGRGGEGRYSLISVSPAYRRELIVRNKKKTNIIRVLYSIVFIFVQYCIV